MKFNATVQLSVKAKSRDEALRKLDVFTRYGLVETVATTPPKGVVIVDTDVVIAPPKVEGNPTFEVTVVKTAVMTISMTEAQAVLKELGEPSNLEAYGGDPKELVEIAISIAEGRNLDLDFDREIFVIQSASQGEQP